MKLEIPEQYKNGSGVYSITNTIDGKRNIGSTSDFYKRFFAGNGHISLLRNNKHFNSHLQSAWNKYGEIAFKIELLELCPVQDLFKRELYFITKFGGIDSGLLYNLTMPDINSPCGHLSQLTKNKISQSNMGRKRTEESKKKMSKCHIGKKLSEETKRKIGEASKGHKLSAEAKRKIGLSASQRNMGNLYCLGRKFSEETKKKMSDSHKGKMSPLRGRKLSEEHKRRLSESHNKYYFEFNIKNRVAVNT